MAINISEPPGKSQPLWHLAFRPFFLSGAIFGAVALLFWLLFLYSGSIPVSPALGALQWHGHEMLYGFGMAIVYGFLLTAVQTWTGIPTITGSKLVLLWGCWLVARLLLLTVDGQLLFLAAFFDLLFQVIGLAFLLGSVIRVRQWRNIFLSIIPLLFLLVNAGFYWSVFQQDYIRQKELLEATMMLFALIVSVMGGRVIPFFTARKLQVEQAKKRLWLEYGCQTFLIFLVIHALAGGLFSPVLLLVCCLAGALFQLIRMATWWNSNLLQHPLLWSLHFSYLFIPLFLLAWAFADTFSWPRNDVLHLLSIGAISGLILAMIARVSLGHTGRNLLTGRAVNVAFALVLAAAVMRFLPAVLPLWRLELYYLSGALWIVAFLLFVLNYWKILISPRADGLLG